MSKAPRIDTVVGDALIGSDTAAFQSPSTSRRRAPTFPDHPTTPQSQTIAQQPTESDPLLGNNSNAPKKKKPFYRARPLWLAPFGLVASLVRGMTLAPRVEVYTQLSCAKLHLDHPFNHTTMSLPQLSHSIIQSTQNFPVLDPNGPSLSPSFYIAQATPSQSYNFSINNLDDDDDEEEEDPRNVPSSRCLSDTAVNAGAARLQTIMTTTMGSLSALTTGWWGHFSERHGRKTVLAIATFGLFTTDLVFILVSTPGSIFASHSHKLLILAPIIEGSLGGWSALQSAITAYISDCTSPGSRATVFSRFTGLFYVGFSLGPSIAGWIIRSGIGAPAGQKAVTAVFWLAIICSFINFFLVLFVFPESLSKEKLARAKELYILERDKKGKARSVTVHDREVSEQSEIATDADEPPVKGRSVIYGFLSPLALFLPVTVTDSTGKASKDWSLTFLAMVLFAYYLSTGLYQIKYLFATHVFGWSVEQLGYYISFMGAVRASYLLIFLPLIISKFKPKLKTSSKPKGTSVSKSGKPKPTKASIAQEIKFDAMIAKVSLGLDLLANIVISAMPVSIPMPSLFFVPEAAASSSSASQALFVAVSCLASMGASIVPAIQSLSLCIIQARNLLATNDATNTGAVSDNDSDATGKVGIGKLLGALAVLQAIGQMILGPLFFGLVYTNTVAHYPKTIFVLAAGVLFFSFVCILLLRNPVENHLPGKAQKGKGKKAIGKRRLIAAEEEHRGRSRVSKDLFGHPPVVGDTDTVSTDLGVPSIANDSLAAAQSSSNEGSRTHVASSSTQSSSQ